MMSDLNPISRENLGWLLAAILASKNYPKLARALGKTALYIGLTPIREARAISSIFYSELTKPSSQLKPITSKDKLGRAAAKARPAVALAGRALASPAVLGTAAAVAVTSYGMAKQNPPPTIAFMRVPV